VLGECVFDESSAFGGSREFSEDYSIAGVENDRDQDAAGITQSWVITDANSEIQHSVGVSSENRPVSGAVCHFLVFRQAANKA
jgi:hypothetical protein